MLYGGETLKVVRGRHCKIKNTDKKNFEAGPQDFEAGPQTTNLVPENLGTPGLVPRSLGKPGFRAGKALGHQVLVPETPWDPSCAHQARLPISAGLTLNSDDPIVNPKLGNRPTKDQ